jgi:uncharacterized protein (TIGR02246 family)
MAKWAVLTAILTLSWSPSQDPTSAIEALFSRLMEADNAGDLEGVLNCYARDATLMPPDGPPVKGIENIRPRYASLFEGSRLAVTMTSEELEVSGDWAFSRGKTTGRIVPKDGSAPRSLRDKYLMILRRTEADGWRIAILMWSPMSPD